MPRIRTVKPDFFRSPDTAAVDFPCRLFYMALWCWADDFGIGETNINGLLGFAFPDDDGFSAQDVRRFCADVAQHYQVDFYTVRGRHYYAIPSWEKHQKLERRQDRRKNPLPTDPEAVPDLRFQACADFAPILRGQGSAERVLEGEREGEAEVAQRTNLTLITSTEPPPIRCKKHLNEPSPPNCPGCGDARRFHAEWKSNIARAEQERRDALQAAIAACQLCDPKGMREVGDDATRCNHNQEAM
jgi:hypothetical protein